MATMSLLINLFETVITLCEWNLMRNILVKNRVSISFYITEISKFYNLFMNLYDNCNNIFLVESDEEHFSANQISISDGWTKDKK